MRIVSNRPIADIWWLVLIQGIAALVLGLLLVISPGMTTTVLVTVLGVYWLVHGILAIVAIFVVDSAVPWWLSLLGGVIGILAGIFVLNHPWLSAILVPTTLVIVIAVQALLMGIIGLIQGIRGDGWAAIILGAVNVLVGIILLGSPLVAALVLVVVIGILQVFSGVALTVLAVRMRRELQEAVA